MKVIKINFQVPQREIINQAVKILKSGGVVVYPTDTAYGLGGIFNKRQVINKILNIKGRTDKKFTVIVSGVDQYIKFFKPGQQSLALAKKYWPGPLSIVVSPSLAVRAPKNKIALALARAAGCPLIATSANLTGQPASYSGRSAARQFKNQKIKPELVLDAGALKKNKPSTIVKVIKDKVVLIRPGGINPII